MGTSIWKDYSAGYIKHNRNACLSIIIAVSISALLLSLLCGLFYNVWKYEVERIERVEGDWQSRITGELDESMIERIQDFANVKDVVVKGTKEREVPEEKTVVADLYFYDKGSVIEDTLRIAEAVGVSPDAAEYHYELLAMYLIRSEKDTAPRLMFPLLLVIIAVASISLIIIIHNSFAVSMNARVHQIGIFSSIGATPKQIRACLLQEAALLCTVPILAGNLLGIFIGMGLLTIVNVMLGSDSAGRHNAVFGYHPLVFGLTLFVTIITIWISAWLPAAKLSKLTPLEAIKNTDELQLKRKKNSPILALLFGTEGELAGSALIGQRKALRTATVSLVFSFMAFTVMQCFFTLSGISTRITYFEKYQKVWDIMITVQNKTVDSLGEVETIQALPGIRSAVAYQKAAAKTIVTKEELSDEMKSLGGFVSAPENQVQQMENGWLVNAPLVILDDVSFLAYCEKLGIEPKLDGAVVRNKIRDVTNPDYRNPVYLPYVKGETDQSILMPSDSEGISVEIPVLSYIQEVPVLREDYATLDYYEFVHFLPASLWKEIKGQIGGAEQETYLTILGRERATLEELNAIQKKAEQVLAGTDQIESENRIQEKAENEKQISGMMTIWGGFCVLLAMIGIGNVFSNTLGFVNQRKREFARYMSVGMTPEEFKKMFCIEVLVIAGRPLCITLPLAFVIVGVLLKASYLEVGIFLEEAPFIPVIIFLFTILGMVALAYYLGWRKVRKIDLAEVLRDDTFS